MNRTNKRTGRSVRLLRTLAATLVLSGVAGSLAIGTAYADDHHRDDRHRRIVHRRDFHHDHDGGVYVAPAPVYAPPPVVYAQPGVEFATPGINLMLNFH